MKIADKIKIKDNEYICTQIILLKDMRIYRVHSLLDSEKLFIMKKDNNYQVITNEKILKEIYELLEIKNTDVVVN